MLSTSNDRQSKEVSCAQDFAHSSTLEFLKVFIGNVGILNFGIRKNSDLNTISPERTKKYSDEDFQSTHDISYNF